MPQKRPCSKTPHKPLSSAAALGGRGAVMDASTSLVRGHCPVGAARGAGRGRGAKARGGGVPPPLARRRSACRKRRRRCRGLREVVRGGSRGRGAPCRRMRRPWVGAVVGDRGVLSVDGVVCGRAEAQLRLAACPRRAARRDVRRSLGGLSAAYLGGLSPLSEGSSAMARIVCSQQKGAISTGSANDGPSPSHLRQARPKGWCGRHGPDAAETALRRRRAGSEAKAEASDHAPRHRRGRDLSATSRRHLGDSRTSSSRRR